MTHVVPRPLVDDQEADPQLRALLSSARASSALGDADLARFTARFAPLIGVPLVASAVPGTASAPVAPAGLEVAGKGALATGKAAAGKLIGASALKLTAASLAVGASLWFARDVIRPVPAQVAPQVQPAVAAPVVVPAPIVEPRSPEVAVEQPVQPSAVKRRSTARASVKSAQPAPDELTLIHEAQALRKEPARALALLAQHRQLYPAGLLSQEREVLAVEALLASGRRADAEARGNAFMRAYPGSVHMARLRSMLQQPLAD